MRVPMMLEIHLRMLVVNVDLSNRQSRVAQACRERLTMDLVRPGEKRGTRTIFVEFLVTNSVVASQRRQHIVFGRRRLKLIVHRDEQNREARRVSGRTCFWRSLVMLTFR